jgi:hypothetical protein
MPVKTYNLYTFFESMTISKGPLADCEDRISHSPLDKYVRVASADERRVLEAGTFRRKSEPIRVAVSDGATESSWSGMWAQILTDAFVEGKLSVESAEDFTGAVPKLAEKWKKDTEGLLDPANQRAVRKRDQGAWATFLGLELDIAGGTWKAVSVGDTCLLRNAQESKPRLASWPVEKASDFDTNPPLVSTADGSTPTPKLTEGRLENGTHLWVATDALSKFLIQWPGVLLDRERFSEVADGLFEMLGPLQGGGVLKMDDLTLVSVEFDKDETVFKRRYALHHLFRAGRMLSKLAR